MSITLTAEQYAAINSVINWLKESAELGFPGYREFRFCGFAGTGKTTTMKEMIAEVQKDYPTVPILCVAPTGKAASVLRKKIEDAVPVSTVHGLIYKLSNEDNGQPTWTRTHKEGALKGSLIILDEASMAGTEMIADIQATGAMLLAVGDTMQLPPVKQESWLLRRTPNAQLMQVHRQALDNPIVALSMRIRAHERITAADACAEIEVHDRMSKIDGWETVDQILVGTNLQRNTVNMVARKRLHGEVEPGIVAGDKLVCLRNVVVDEEYISNGQLIVAEGKFASCRLDNKYLDGYGYFDGLPAEEDCISPIKLRTNKEIINAVYGPQPAPEVRLSTWTERHGAITNLDYGYALTVHKFQGSEADDVIVVDGKTGMKDRMFRSQWLYTAVTRAKKKLRFVL